MTKLDEIRARLKALSPRPGGKGWRSDCAYLLAEVERLRRERDEARAEVERLRETVRQLMDRSVLVVDDLRVGPAMVRAWRAELDRLRAIEAAAKDAVKWLDSERLDPLRAALREDGES
jgi:phosphoribosylpyrophosphate synthetase